MNDKLPPTVSDPVVEAYMVDIDRTLLQANLKLSVEDRIRQLQQFQKFVMELQRAGREAHRITIDIMGTRFVLIPEAELAAIEGPDFPPIDKDGTCEALPFLRASIARDIIRGRRELGLTQAQLAKLAGIRQETLSRLESGKHKPNVRTVERIEAALKRNRPKR